VLYDDAEDTTPDTTEPTISTHALTGIQPQHCRTMQLRVVINGSCLLTLLDSGSTHNFINTEAAPRVGIAFFGHDGLRVAVSNGDRLYSSGCCRDMRCSIAGEEFSIDCYGLTLISYEMVLGVHWLESLGPILWDFSRHILAFVRNGHQVTWTA
jgi:hypothetical protein